MSEPKEIYIRNEKDFEQKVLKSKEPVVVGFDAPWCQPCKIINEKVKDVVQEQEGKVALAKVDTAEVPEIAQKNDVLVLPAVAIVNDGKVQSKIVGNPIPEEVKEFVEENIKTEEEKSQEQEKEGESQQEQQKEEEKEEKDKVKKAFTNVILPLQETNAL